MNYDLIFQKLEKYNKIKTEIPEATASSYEAAFEVEYTHNSTAIEGNTLSMIETKAVLEEGLAIGGKTMRELHEVRNHWEAYRYVKECVADGVALGEGIIKDIHALLMKDIIQGGIYRNVVVFITGAKHKPPVPGDMYIQVKNFYMDLPEKKQKMNAIEFAAWCHAEFVKIHPFVDGNGRTSRLIMNYQLIAAEFPAVSIAKENRVAYFEALEAYAVEGDLAPFADMVAELVDAKLDELLSLVA